MSRAFALWMIASLVAPSAHAQTTVWDSIGRILQTSPVASGGFRRYSFPRRDLTLRVGDVAVSPRLALIGWAGFTGLPQAAIMMGDLVVTESELRAVEAVLDSQHLVITAVHNHLLGESPRVMYVHVHGEGTAVDLARALDRALARTTTPRGVALPASAPVTFDTAAVFSGLGVTGTASGMVAQVSLMLVATSVKLHGQALPPGLVAGTALNIQAVTADRFVATGDFAVTGDRVAAIIGALTAHAITATAVHNHMIEESPLITFIHFWADGAPADVLAGLKAALDAAKAGS